MYKSLLLTCIQLMTDLILSLSTMKPFHVGADCRKQKAGPEPILNVDIWHSFPLAISGGGLG